MATGDAAAISSIVKLGAGPAAALIVAVPAIGLQYSSCVRVLVTIATHRCPPVGRVDPTTVYVRTRRGSDWEKREQQA